MVPRAVLAVVAVLVVGWIAVLERNHLLQSRAQSDLARLDEAGTFGRVTRDLRDARLLNPDSEPELALAYVYQSHGDLGRAAEVAERVARRERSNLLAWGLLYSVTLGREPRRAAVAQRMIRRLDPLNARRD
jgi:hypothetical protein